MAQAAAKLVLEPIFEADFRPCSYGYRPKRTDEDTPPVYVQLTLDDETRYRGVVAFYSTDIDMENRELVLSPPIRLRRKEGMMIRRQWRSS